VSGLRLAGGVAPDGGPITIDCFDGRIAAVIRDEAVTAVPQGYRVVDVSGHVLMPAMAEPHAHVDKAYTADEYPNPTGDLAGAIAVSHLSFMASSASDIERRARRAFAAYVSKGCLAVRSHVVVVDWLGLRSLEGVLRAAEAFAPFLDIQLVAHGGPGTTGLAGATQRALLSDAIAMGVTHIGGTPYRADDPREETATLLELAGNAGMPVDFHTDETIDPAIVSVRDLAELVMATGFTNGVAASHCVSLGVIPPAMQAEIAELLVAANVAVISLPQTNLFLQSREVGHAKPRGLTALDALFSAGVLVAAGGDNVQDPFNPMGRADPLEAASLLVTAGHLDVADAFEAVSASARRVMGLDAQGFTEGAPADLVAVPGQTLREAMAEADPRRIVVRRGEVAAAASLAQLTDGWKPKWEVVGV
jgi:cytosine/creatinine deaminase